MNRDARKRPYDAFQASRMIAEFTQGRTFEQYRADAMLRSAVERQFEIIGEALRLAEVADPTVAEGIPDLRKIVGMRNRIIHVYDAVDSETIWNAVQVQLPQLREQLAAALNP